MDMDIELEERDYRINKEVKVFDNNKVSWR